MGSYKQKYFFTVLLNFGGDIWKRYLEGLNFCGPYGEADPRLNRGLRGETPAPNSVSYTTTLKLLVQFVTLSP